MAYLEIFKMIWWFDTLEIIVNIQIIFVNNLNNKNLFLGKYNFFRN